MADTGCVIRDACAADAAEMARIYEHYVRSTAITFDFESRSQKAFEELIQSTQQRFPFLVVEAGDGIAGYAYAARFRRQAAYDACIELSIYLDPACTGAGIGASLYRELESRLSEAGITNLYACIAYPVEPDEYLDYSSVSFHERMGFATVGRFHGCGRKFGRTYDMIWMEKLIG